MNLIKSSKQRIFDKVLHHLRRQGKPSVSPNIGCAYRSEDENGNVLMCAAGCLIPDSEYFSNMEAHRADTLPFFADVLRPKGIQSNKKLSLIQDLQYAHDEWHRRKEDIMAWEEKMRSLAASYSLKYKAPK